MKKEEFWGKRDCRGGEREQCSRRRRGEEVWDAGRAHRKAGEELQGLETDAAQRRTGEDRKQGRSRRGCAGGGSESGILMARPVRNMLDCNDAPFK